MRLLCSAVSLAVGVLVLACRGDDRSAVDTRVVRGAVAPDAAAPGIARVGPDSAEIPAGLVKAAFSVEGMTCGGCVIGTRMALAKVAGVRTADAAYDEKTKTGTAWAIYDPATTTPAHLMAAIRKLGYEPTPLGG